MKKSITILVAILVVVVGVWIFVSKYQGGATKIEEPTTLNTSGATAAGVDVIVKRNNKFSDDLYTKIASEQKGQNIFYSPFSISSAFAMVYEGAAGQTAQEIQNVFGFSSETASRRGSFASLYNTLNAPSTSYTFNVANALWAEKTFDFLPSYLNTVKTYYGGGATNLDFKNNAENSRITINDWVAGKTNDKIKDLLPAGSLNSLTRLVLTNAVYFKGKWETAFDKSDTYKQDFHVDSSTTVSTDMMHKDHDFKYAEDDQAQVLEMPYKGGSFAMLAVLPKGDISSLEQSLTSDKISAWINSLSTTEVNVTFPKFTFSTKYSLKQTLADMGMPTIFTDSADLSGMDGRKDLAVSDVFHQAYVSVDEEGTEAAGATGVAVATMSIGIDRSKHFVADHPFLFYILDTHTNNIVFAGRVSDPTK